MMRLALAAAAALLATTAAAQSPYSPAAGRAQAGPADFARFDARATGDLPAKLALCDATRFLVNDPDLDSDRTFVRRRDGRFDLLLPPDFVGGAEWYDEDIERAYRRLRRNGEVDYATVQAARRDISRAMVRVFERVGGSERAFLRDQSRYCDEVEDLGRRS